MGKPHPTFGNGGSCYLGTAIMLLSSENIEERGVRGEGKEGWLQTLLKREGDGEATTNGGFLWLSPVGD